MELLLGALLGLGVSLAFWWIQYRVLVPKLHFGQQISKLTDEHGAVYRVKVANESRWRGAIDLALDVRLYLGHGTVSYSEGPLKTLQSFPVPLSNDTIKRIGPGRSRIIRLDLRADGWSDLNPRYRAAAGIDGVDGSEVPLETLLGATSETYLRVRVLAYDEVTGSRKFFQSDELRVDDVRRGKFAGLEVDEFRASTVAPCG